MTNPILKIYEVGGFVRDELLGIPSKDRDCTVVLDPPIQDVDEAFAFMGQWLTEQGYKIFVSTPEHATIRAHSPEKGSTPADFVLARREGPYSDGRRPDWVEIGSLEDDLDRRDFTVNAMARSIDDGILIDRHNGLSDLEQKLLVFVGDPIKRIQEDALRVMRAFRFAITKDFQLPSETWQAICDPSVPELLAHISEERREMELRQMFKHGDTIEVIGLLDALPFNLQQAMFTGRVRLTSTLRK